MDRRAFLGTLAGSALALSGCTSGNGAGADETTTTTEGSDTRTGTPTPTATETPTPTDTPAPTAADVSATLTVVAPMGSRRTRVSVSDGQAVYIVDCGGGDDDDSPERRVEQTVGTETTSRLADLVAAAEPASWKEYYDCTGDCPTDLPSVRVTVTVDGTTYETGYYAGRQEPLPGTLPDIAGVLEGLRGELGKQADPIDCHAK